MQRHIHGMTTGQTKIVCDTVLRLSVEWLKLQDCASAHIRIGAAMADLHNDCYIGLSRVAFCVRDGEACFGGLTWRLAPSFEPLGRRGPSCACGAGARGRADAALPDCARRAGVAG